MLKTNDQLFSKEINYCLKLLKIRPRSACELAERLKQKSAAPDAVKKILAYLGDRGLIDDVQFARTWTAWRIDRGYGQYRVRAELTEKGVPGPIISKVLGQALKEYDEEKAARTIAQKRIKRYANLEPAVVQRRIYGFLVRKGFSQHIALRIVRTYDDP